MLGDRNINDVNKNYLGIRKLQRAYKQLKLQMGDKRRGGQGDLTLKSALSHVG